MNERFNAAMDRIRDELAANNNGQIQLLGEGLTVMLQRHPEWADKIDKKDKSITGALGVVRKNAVKGCSDPIRTTQSLIEYYEIPCEDPRRLAMEVTIGLMGGDETDRAAMPTQAPGKAVEDPFDLDALMGGGQA